MTLYKMSLMKPCISDGTWTHRPGWKPSQNPDWELNPPSLNWDHTWSQDLMTLRFLMSHRRKNLVRDKVIGKKWIYLERNTLYRQSMGCLRRWEALKCDVVSVYGLGNFIGWWMEGIFQGWDFQKLGHYPLFF